MRRNNIRIYGIPEGDEKNDIIDFITRLIKSNIQTKTFATLTKAAPMLEDMGINVDKDRMEPII